ncbi:MAG: Endo/excinuclease amino domain protein [Parcubacteria group bacterium GW2011_GWA2_47_7]|nr:MAG: Endo/excinuclease amino domain protein [Parcubacteria group bacterium GW2011_GWA2_47_7]
MQSNYYVYILLCNNNSLYTGITTDLKRRFAEHEKGTGAKYTRAHPPIEIVYKKKVSNRSLAQKREAKIKKMSRIQKLMLISEIRSNKKKH